MIEKRLSDIIEKWFLFEPVLFRAICTHEFIINNDIRYIQHLYKKTLLTFTHDSTKNSVFFQHKTHHLSHFIIPHLVIRL